MSNDVRVVLSRLAVFVLAAALSTSGCDRAAAPKTHAAAPMHVREVAAEDRPDLSITFDPRHTSENGWVKLPKPITLDLLGDLGAATLDLTAARDPFAGDHAMRQRLLGIALESAALPDTSVIVDEEALCSPALLAAVDKARPHRMLLSIQGGIAAKAVRCLRALPTPRLYLTGCLDRGPGRAPCDGDAELGALVADEVVRARVRGLAVSLRGPAAVAKLGKLPALEYLALSPMRGAHGALFDELPFDELPHVRYLEASGTNASASAMTEPAARFLGRLHTLRWRGEWMIPIAAPCTLERMSSESLRATDMEALAACGQLKELSSDSADFGSAELVARFHELERLHLRHWEADDLALLVPLDKLRSLSLPASKAHDFSFIARMPKLTSVDLSQTALRTLTTFEPLTSLEELDVDFTAVGDLAPLGSLTKLVRLSLHATNTADLSVVRRLTSLQELSISGTPVEDLGPLERHPSLEWVILYESKVTSVSALLTMPRLKRVNIRQLRLPSGQVEQLRQRPGFLIDE